MPTPKVIVAGGGIGGIGGHALPHDGRRPGPVALLGDAVHAMSPALGIGANTAFRDALTLGEELVAAAGGRKPLTTAIAAYEAAMRDYGFAAVRDSAAMGRRVIGHRPLPSPR